MNHEHTAYHGPIDIELQARDSDRMELPDEPNASKNSAPMLLAFLTLALPFLIALVVWLVRLSLQR